MLAHEDSRADSRVDSRDSAAPVLVKRPCPGPRPSALFKRGTLRREGGCDPRGEVRFPAQAGTPLAG